VHTPVARELARRGVRAVVDLAGGTGTLARDIVHTEFDVVEVEHWDAPMIRLPDERALVLFLRGRGLSDDGARRAAARLTTPLRVTKRGCLVWGRRRPVGARRSCVGVTAGHDLSS
jgi:hypothetical protein